MTVRIRLGGMVLLMVTITACSGSTDASDTSPAPVPTDATPSTAPLTTEPPVSTTTVPPTTLVPRLVFQFDTIEITSPDSGGGDRPQLMWEAVEGASLYSVTVFAPNGRAYWATQAATTSVHVGGEPQLDDDAAGPSVVKGMTWQVVAVGNDGTPLAMSDRSPISP